ncbi:hypothetical protein PIB30_042892 [Stylosanthes scabra]|uniref:RNase H type-1 domain-containing protein n=1 Tax=Stylosanthes scabra TaxID=79078 RepID=A0ABU6SFA0_9FABA|nr:hypothetical protein [Stylosanthes scabra]
MGSGVIFYEYEKREEFEDHDMRADAELGTFKIRRYHFDNESFVHPLHIVRLDPDRPYEIPIEALMADKIANASKSEESSAKRRRLSRRPSPLYSPRTMPVAQRERSTSSVKGTCSFRRGTASGSVRKPRSWELIPPSEGWMCDADDEKEIGGMDPSEKGESSEEDPKMEEEYLEEAENPEDRVPATPSLPMDIDAEEEFQRYVEELGRVPEPSPLRSMEAADRQSASCDSPSYHVSGIWPPKPGEFVTVWYLESVLCAVSKIGVLHKAHPRAVNCVWRILNKSLPTKHNLQRRAIRSSENPELDVQEWIEKLFKVLDPQLQGLLCNCLLELWLTRNWILFEDKHVSPMDATAAASKKHGDFLTAIQKIETELKTPPPGSESSDNWREPSTHMVKINVDSTIINDKVVGIGVIARDCQGQILMASTWRKALSLEVHEAEALGCLLGLEQFSPFIPAGEIHLARSQELAGTSHASHYSSESYGRVSTPSA